MFSFFRLPDAFPALLCPADDLLALWVCHQASLPRTAPDVLAIWPADKRDNSIHVQALLHHPTILAAALVRFKFTHQQYCLDVETLAEWLAQQSLDAVFAGGDSAWITNDPTASAKTTARQLKRMWKASQQVRRWRRHSVDWRHWSRALSKLIRNASGWSRKLSKRLIKQTLSKSLAKDLSLVANRLRKRSESANRLAELAIHAMRDPVVEKPRGTASLPVVANGPLTNGQAFDERLWLAKMESLRQFAYGASHELNNPLANIVMRAQSLLRHETCVDRRKKLQTIETQALRAHEMISDVMLFAHPPQPRFDSVDLRELVGSVLIEMEPMFATRRIEVRQSAEGQFTDWQVDVTQLAECLRALFKNAIESIGQDGWMNVSLARDESEARLSICDSGAGIDPHIIQHIFDPFFSGREAGRGLGFGLSKAWRIVQLHGGRITCINPIAGHTTFEIALPQHQNGSVSM